MKKYTLDNNTIKECLDINIDFSSINEFCDFINNKKDLGSIKVEFKKMLLQKLNNLDPKDKKDIQQNSFADNIQWINDNCALVSENNNSQAQDCECDINVDESIKNEIENTAENTIPESDFEKIKYQYENHDYKNITQLDEKDIDYTAGITILESGIVTQQNNYQLFVKNEKIKLDLSKILIVEAKGTKVLAMGYLIADNKNTYTMVFSDRKCIDYKELRDNTQARFILYSKNSKIYSLLFDMEFKPFREEDERPLCIDFGTSNTTVGSYGILDRDKDEAEIVKFIDVTAEKSNCEVTMLPTIVYVDDCSDPNNIKYLFGYEARKRIEDEHYESKASVFYEIKRWVADADKPEEIRDEKNNRAKPLKREIIKAYLDYVIEQSEQYFGTRFEKLHFSAPVKLKESFIDLFTELYKNEKIVLSSEESIDEGIAIVYNQIISLIGIQNKKADEKKSILVLDCGGGTTDLASCEYEYKDTEKGRELKINTGFENGNSNFGGNNITYRIMQLLKIKVAASIKKDFIDDNGDIFKLIDSAESEILGLVDSIIKKGAYDSDNTNYGVYSKFIGSYNKAEEIIPTVFNGNEKFRGTESLKKIKRNYFYLWRQAEQIKIDFYKAERVIMNFSKDYSNDEGTIQIISPENYYLYVVDNNELKRFDNPFKNTTITIKEINRAICGDIYSLLVGIFGNEYFSDNAIKVDKYDFYKLSGQSCKISLFSELLKEYIPGKKLRPLSIQKAQIENRTSEELKLQCILGCINYVKDQRRPEMNIDMTQKDAEFIYDIYLKCDHGKNKIMFDHNNINSIIMDQSHKNTREYPFSIQRVDGSIEKEFIVDLYNYREKYSDDRLTTSKIKEKIGKTCASSLTSDGIDKFIENIENVKCDENETVNIVFTIPAKSGYGVYIGQIQKEHKTDGDKYSVIRYSFQNFEDSTKTFFDGRR